MNAHTYRVFRSFALQRDRAGRRRRLFLLLGCLLFPLSLFSCGRDGNLLPTPLPLVVSQPAALAQAFLRPRGSEVLGDAFQGLIFLLLRKSRGAGAGCRLRAPYSGFLFRRSTLLLFLRIGGLSLPPLALGIFSLSTSPSLFPLSTLRLLSHQELLFCQPDLLDCPNQGVVLIRLPSLDLREIVLEVVWETIFQVLPPRESGQSGLLVQAPHRIDVSKHISTVLHLAELVIARLVFEVGLEALIHRRQERMKGILLKVRLKVVTPSLKPIKGLLIQVGTHNSDEISVVIPGPLVVMQIVVHLPLPPLIGGVASKGTLERSRLRDLDFLLLHPSLYPNQVFKLGDPPVLLSILPFLKGPQETI